MQLSYLSKTPGIGGSIKNSPEDFVVEEIGFDGTTFEIGKKILNRENANNGRFAHFVLQKRNWSTTNAIKEISRRLRISHVRFNTAGMKDKNAVTTQLVSVLGISPEQILRINVKDISINGAWQANERVGIGDLIGNRFVIKIIDAKKDADKIVYEITAELNDKFPNYFGKQRFGSSRANTHIVGEKIIRGLFEEAVMIYLIDSDGESNEESRLARKELSETMDFSAALKNFPKHLTLERTMLDHLAKSPGDYINALRALPRNMLLMFVHAFQSNLFNIVLSDRISEGELNAEQDEYFCGENEYGFPDVDKKADNGFLVAKLIGYQSEINEREHNLLEKFGITRMNFKIKALPEISSKGGYRTVFAPLKDFSFAENTLKFSLPSGSYATVALREFLDSKD